MLIDQPITEIAKVLVANYNKKSQNNYAMKSHAVLHVYRYN